MSDCGAAEGIWAIIPVKQLTEAKSRLGLTHGERRTVALDFLTRVLGVVGDVLPTHRIVLISRDETVLTIARAAGASALREAAEGDLNDALTVAAIHAHSQGATGVLSVFSDLPYLAADDLDAMIAAFDGHNLVIAPDQDGAGSNVLLMPPLAIPYRHGLASLWRHIDAARDAGLAFEVMARPGLMRDVDTFEQLSAYVAEAAAMSTRTLASTNGRTDTLMRRGGDAAA